MLSYIFCQRRKPRFASFAMVAIITLIVLNEQTTLRLGGFYLNFLFGDLKGEEATFRALLCMQVALVFFNFLIACFFINPHIVVDGVNATRFFCYLLCIKVGIFLLFRKFAHLISGRG